jgi:hypothetical protein
MEELPEDYYVNQFAFTKEIYRNVYSAVNPENERLSQKGKVVVITGASQGIGQKVWHNIGYVSESENLFLFLQLLILQLGKVSQLRLPKLEQKLCILRDVLGPACKIPKGWCRA